MTSTRILGLVTVILATLVCSDRSMFNGEPRLTIKAEKNMAFDESCLIEKFKIKSGNIADCMGHCLEDCRCQSFQICQEECQLCSSHKEENNSLVRDKNECVYAVCSLTNSMDVFQFQEMDYRCSGISSYMRYNCCQRSGLCPAMQKCKPRNSIEQPWKRFTCECKEGYNGANCDQPIRSCVGYLDRHRQSRLYKVIASDHSLYEVYCHFDSDGHAWTLVQSFSFVRRAASNSDFEHSLTTDHPISENKLQWSGYRLSKPLMRSINKNSNYIRFTCDYEKEDKVDNSDYLQISLDDLGSNKDLTTIMDLYDDMTTFEGKINEKSLAGCELKLHQNNKGLHVHLDHDADCVFVPTKPRGCKMLYYFSYFPDKNCLLSTHRCTQNVNSTTQQWFGQL